MFKYYSKPLVADIVIRFIYICKNHSNFDDIRVLCNLHFQNYSTLRFFAVAHLKPNMHYNGNDHQYFTDESGLGWYFVYKEPKKMGLRANCNNIKSVSSAAIKYRDVATKSVFGTAETKLPSKIHRSKSGNEIQRLPQR